MKLRLLHIGLLLTSLIGYLEWAGDNSMFLFQAELDIIALGFDDPKSILHPFILIPFAGQILFLINLILKKPNRILTYIGIGGIGLLLGLMFLIGIMELNLKILSSTLPFLILSVYTILYIHRLKVMKK